MKTFLVLGAAFGLIGVALGAFGSHALRSRLASERLGAFETGVRYQMWHALALFVVVIVDAWTPTGVRSSYTLVEGGTGWPLLAAGWSSSPGSCCFQAACTRWPLRDIERRGRSPRSGEHACCEAGRRCCSRSW